MTKRQQRDLWLRLFFTILAEAHTKSALTSREAHTTEVANATDAMFTVLLDRIRPEPSKFWWLVLPSIIGFVVGVSLALVGISIPTMVNRLFHIL